MRNLAFLGGVLGDLLSTLFFDYDFSVEHTGASVRWKAGTLERVAKYYQRAFTKAWNYLASSPSDGEDD